MTGRKVKDEVTNFMEFFVWVSKTIPPVRDLLAKMEHDGLHFMRMSSEDAKPTDPVGTLDWWGMPFVPPNVCAVDYFFVQDAV